MNLTYVILTPLNDQFQNHLRIFSTRSTIAQHVNRSPSSDVIYHEYLDRVFDLFIAVYNWLNLLISFPESFFFIPFAFKTIEKYRNFLYLKFLPFPFQKLFTSVDVKDFLSFAILTSLRSIGLCFNASLIPYENNTRPLCRQTFFKCSQFRN